MFNSKKIFHKSIKSRVFISKIKLFSSEANLSVDWKNAKPYNEIPGPKNAFEMLKLMGPGGKYQNLALDKLTACFRRDYGSLARFPAFLGQKQMVMTFLPEDIETMHRQEGKFPNRRVLDSVAYFRKEHRPELYPAGAGITITQGQEWYDFRSKVQQVMMQPRATKIYVPGIDEVARDFVDKIRKLRDNNDEMPSDFLENINEWALESVGLIALDTRLGIFENPAASKLNQYIKQIFQATFDFDMQPSIWRYMHTPGFKKALKLYEDTTNEIKKYTSEAIERYEKHPTPSDQESGVLEKLIKIDKNIGTTMAEDMLVAGVDTTSSALTTVMYCLAKNPEKQEILRKEVLTILPEKNSKLNATSFNSVPYLRAVIKESLRVIPVVSANVRATTKDMVLQGYRIPQGVDVLLSNSLLSQDEAQFKQSDKFIPERWLKDNNDPLCPRAKDAHPFTYLPFGFGSRMCIGRRFAELEIEVLISRLLREFKLEWHQPDLKFKSTIINVPDGSLKFKIIDL